MSKRNQRENSPWKRLKNYKPPHYKSLVAWIIISMVLSVLASFLLSYFVQIPEEWIVKLGLPQKNDSSTAALPIEVDEPEIVEIPVQHEFQQETLTVLINYPSQIVPDDFDRVFINVNIFDQDGPIIGEEIIYETDNQENNEARLMASTDNTGGATLELVISDEADDELLLGTVFIRDMVIPVRINLSQGRDVFAQDLDGDGLLDIDEIRRGTDRFSPDTDGDGLTDYDEIYQWGTDPFISNQMIINVAEPQSLSVYAEVEELTVIFVIEGGKSFEFIWTQQDEDNYYGFFEGYINSNAYDPENQTISQNTNVFIGEMLGEEFVHLTQDVNKFEVVEQSTNANDESESLYIRIFIRVAKQEIQAAEALDAP
jgi:hypothetical protein